MAFVKYHQPCYLCDSSDAVSVNDDGSAYCFSCDKRIPNYEVKEGVNKNIVQAKLAKQQKVNVEKGEETKALTEQIVNLQAFALIGHANYNREG